MALREIRELLLEIQRDDDAAVRQDARRRRKSFPE
jgi:hypothetical protein